MKRIRSGSVLRVLLLGVLLAAVDGCAVRRLVLNKVGDALAAGGTTFSADDDPELVRQAVPFSLKLMESLLAENPRHAGLLRSVSAGFTQYAYAFVQQDADELESKDFAGAEVLRGRARRLYVRARDYGLRGLEVAHPGFTGRLSQDPAAAVSVLKKSDVPGVYWASAAWAAAISLGKDDPARVAEIPQMEALLDRAFALDPDWGDGALHGLLIAYEMSRPGVSGDPAVRARERFVRAVELGRNRLAGPFVSYAESVSVERQDIREFDELLGRALAVDADAHPEFRLLNLVMQRRARWLLSRREDLFLVLVPEPGRVPAAGPSEP